METCTVEERLQDYLLTHGYRPGDRLPTEATLCSELGVSRTVLRESMRSLLSMGFIDIRRGEGTFVSEVSLPRLADNLTFWGRLLDGEDDVVGRIAELAAAIECGPPDNWIVTQTRQALSSASHRLSTPLGCAPDRASGPGQAAHPEAYQAVLVTDRRSSTVGDQE